MSAAKNIDLALIDNDNLVRMTWEFEASRLKKNIAIFENKESFLKAELPKHIPIYIDYNLDDGVLGTDVARDLFHFGWNNLHMETGTTGVKSPYVQSVRGKDFPK